MKHSYLLVLLFISLVHTSCNKDSDQSGCTDHIAVNYDPSALREDGSCEYNQAEQVIWSNGMRGGWNGNLTEGAYRHEILAGAAYDNLHSADSTGEERSLLLSTAGGNEHYSFFTLLNERDARDFAEGTLRFDCRIQEGAAPDYINLFITGKIWEDGSDVTFRRSEKVEISTHSFNDSTFTAVTVPIRHFGEIMMARVEVVCGFEFEGDRNISVELDNIRWSANRDPD